MSFTAEVLRGVAAYLAAGGVGTWRPSGAYLPDDPSPIFLGDAPGSPDRVIALSAYPIDDDASLSDSVLGLQVRTRGLPSNAASTDDLDDDVFDRLHAARGINAGEVRIVQAHRRSGAPIGRDGNRRFERSSNYYLTAHRPSQHRT